MEFAVIDADVLRSNRAAAERDESAYDEDDVIAGFEDVEKLDLCCSNILHITNLCLLSSSNLTSLKLSVNRINKICNIQSFTNLVELDLSHNHIKQIENLEELVKLKRLILNHNPLTSVQNLDSQRNSLEMLDIGYCKITDLKFTLYLKQFPNLISLIVEGNPFGVEPADYERKFIVSTMQSLLVYNNKTVTAVEKKEGRETFRKLIILLEKKDEKLKRLKEEERLRLERTEVRKNAFVDRIPEGEDVDFNVSVFRNPTVEQVLRENVRYGIHNAYRVYAEDFRRLVSEITTAAETNREIRMRLVDELHGELRRSIDNGVEESRKNVLAFMEFEKRLKRELYEDFDNLKTETSSISSARENSAGEDESGSSSRRAALYERFDKRTRAVWMTLMRHEDDLSRKITEMIDELRDALEKLIAEFKWLVKSRFSDLQRQQNIFLQFVLEYAVSSAQNTNNRFHRASKFTNDISQCMESQALQMEHAELYITKSATKWHDDILNDLNRLIDPN